LRDRLLFEQIILERPPIERTPIERFLPERLGESRRFLLGGQRIRRVRSVGPARSVNQARGVWFELVPDLGLLVERVLLELRRRRYRRLGRCRRLGRRSSVELGRFCQVMRLLEAVVVGGVLLVSEVVVGRRRVVESGLFGPLGTPPDRP
jgi:hypothetical protein